MLRALRPVSRLFGLHHPDSGVRPILITIAIVISVLVLVASCLFHYIETICVDSDDDPILLFDAEGSLVKSFGAGQIAWPHGMFVDAEGNVRVADAVG